MVSGVGSMVMDPRVDPEVGVVTLRTEGLRMYTTVGLPTESCGSWGCWEAVLGTGGRGEFGSRRDRRLKSEEREDGQY